MTNKILGICWVSLIHYQIGQLDQQIKDGHHFNLAKIIICQNLIWAQYIQQRFKLALFQIWVIYYQIWTDANKLIYYLNYTYIDLLNLYLLYFHIYLISQISLGMEKQISSNTNSNANGPYRHKPIRFLVLVLLAFVVFANLYTFNNPQALQDSLQEQLQIGQKKFNLLYTIIALPNIIFAGLIGVLLDYFGIRKAFIIMAIGAILSQTVVAFGGVYKSYTALLIGRFLYGVFQQSMSIAQQCYVTSWFMGKQIGMALGLAITLPQFGSALNSYLTPLIYEKYQKLGPPLFVSVGMLTLSLICILIVTYLDIKADQADEANNVKVITDLDKQEQLNQTIKLSDLKILKWSFWLICFLCTFAIASYIPFLDNVNQLLQVRFCFSQLTAGKNITITYIVVGLFGFPIGWLVDKVGYKRYFCFVGMAILTIGHGIILVYPQCLNRQIISTWSGASWGLFLLGIGYCFYANCLIPSIPLVVSKKVLGTAFGIVEMFQNIAMGVYPYIAGFILQDAKTPELGYRHFSLFYFVTGLFGLFLSTFLFFINPKDKRKLDASSSEKYTKTIQIIYIASTDTQQIERAKRKKLNKIGPGYKTDYELDNSQNQDEGQRPPLKKFQLQLSSKPKSQKQNQRKQHYIVKQKKFIQEGDVSFEQNIQDKKIQRKKTREKPVKQKSSSHHQNSFQEIYYP